MRQDRYDATATACAGIRMITVAAGSCAAAAAHVFRRPVKQHGMLLGAVALTMTSALGAQVPRASTTARPMAAPPKRVALTPPTRDNTAQAVTITPPRLHAVMPFSPPIKATVWLYGARMEDNGGSGYTIALPPGSFVWFNATGAPMQPYHVRFNFAFEFGSSAQVSIHTGNDPSDPSGPVVATCMVTAESPVCDIVTTPPAHGQFSLFATPGGGGNGVLRFISVYAAPTTLPTQ